ncbi:uncharacterized protein LOC134818276 [Bolinopsis microptera]|uniref:uncharacterized protein LOC134818276 n=1 Tax=Bolinopsis microptera TaxID=2820187 RepID=UPI00307AE6DB
MAQTIKGWPPNINFTETCKLLRGCPGQECDNLSDVYPVNSLPQDIEREFRNKCKWANCRRRFDKPELLLSHVERCHVWSQDNCPQKVKCLWKGCEEDNFSHRHTIMVHVRDHCEQQLRVRVIK